MCAWCCCRTWRPTWSTSPRSSCGRSSCRRSDTGGGGWGPSQGGRGARVGAGGPGAAAGGKAPRVHSTHRLREGGDHALTLRGDEHPRGPRPSDLRGPRPPAPWPSAPSPAAREPGQAPPSGPRFVLISCERRHRWPQAARLRTGRPHLWVRGEAPVPPRPPAAPAAPACLGVRAVTDLCMSSPAFSCTYWSRDVVGPTPTLCGLVLRSRFGWTCVFKGFRRSRGLFQMICFPVRLIDLRILRPGVRPGSVLGSWGQALPSELAGGAGELGRVPYSPFSSLGGLVTNKEQKDLTCVQGRVAVRCSGRSMSLT